MADVQFYGGLVESSDDSSEIGIGDDMGVGGPDDYDSDTGGAESGMTPLQRLEQYLDSEHSYSRQMVARSLLDTLKVVEFSDNGSEKVLQAMIRLSDDPDGAVRTELMDQIPRVAIYYRDTRPLYCTSVCMYLLPIVIKFIADCNNQVRKSCHASLLNLVKENLISPAEIEFQIAPVILELAETESIDDFRTEAVSLMTRLAQLIGHDLTERLFLKRFSEMCTDALFHVRKVCALNFGEICRVVGQQSTEQILLPKFFYLCEDGVWGVRNACAECFAIVSSVCSPQVRRDDLAQLFINLICDQSRWVRMAAFQALGAFIATFADPSVTGLQLDESGHVIFKELPINTAEEKCERKVSTGDCVFTETCDITAVPRSSQIDNSKSPGVVFMDSSTTIDIPGMHQAGSQQPMYASRHDSSGLMNSMDTLASTCSLDNADDNEFNSWNFWRLPPADISLQPAGEQSSNAANDSASNIHANNVLDALSAGISEITTAASDGDEDEPCAILPYRAAISALSSHAGAFSNESPVKVPIDESVVDHATVSDMSVVLASSGIQRQSGVTESEVKTFMDIADKESHANVLQVVTDSVGNKSTMASSELRTHYAVESTDMGYTSIQPAKNLLFGQCRSSVLTSVDFFSLGGSSSSYSGLLSAHPSTTEEPNSASARAQQSVVPRELLEHYVGMSDPSRAQTVDSEILKHCAYSMPAVAYTLGRKNWPCIKDLYDSLTKDMQWKVRRTLAFSLHELALILGDAIISSDLVPVFDEFLKDVDEVRIGVLKHLADFLRLLRPEVRRSYLTKLPEFLKADNSRNWRFRKDLAEQMLLLLELFSPTDIVEHLAPMALALSVDKVAQVRLAILPVLSGILKQLSMDVCEQQWIIFVTELNQLFAQSNNWCRRHTFVLVCDHALHDEPAELYRFDSELFPVLLAMRSDPVPNVRIALARALATHARRRLEYASTSRNSTVYSELLSALQALRVDQDRDVRQCLGDLSDILPPASTEETPVTDDYTAPTVITMVTSSAE